MSRMTSKPFVWSPVCSLSASQSLHTAPLSFAFRDGALAVEVDHDADTALVAPFGGVACTHTHDSGIVCRFLDFDVAFPSSLHMRVGCLVQRLMATTLMTNDQLGLKERRDASSAGPPEHPCGMHAVLGGTQHCAVYDRLVLPDAEMLQGPLASVAGATAPVAGRVHHCPAPDMRHPHREHVLHPSALLKPDIEELHSPLSPLGSLREPCQHACLKHPYRTLGPHPSPKSWLSGYHVLKGCRSVTHHK